MPHARNRILVVDDEESSRRALRELLEDQGFAVDTAANGIAALEAAQRNPPTIVLSDVRMPRAGGFHVVQRLRATPELADTPILLMSAYTERAQRIAGLEIGADDYLTKPIDFDELMARIRIHLRHLRRRRGLERRASRDSLTHVLNRGGLMASLRRHQVRARRAHTAVTVRGAGPAGPRRDGAGERCASAAVRPSAARAERRSSSFTIPPGSGRRS